MKRPATKVIFLKGGLSMSNFISFVKTDGLDSYRDSYEF